MVHIVQVAPVLPVGKLASWASVRGERDKSGSTDLICWRSASSFAIGQDWLVGNLNARREYGRIYDRRAWPPASTFASAKLEAGNRNGKRKYASVVYVGTRDNDSMQGRLDQADDAAVQISADYAVIPMQDILALGKEAA